MMIPPRDWLLLRGRMRAVAKIAVLPVLLKVAGHGEPERRAEQETTTPAAEPDRSTG